jgi:hypothetical protein
MLFLGWAKTRAKNRLELVDRQRIGLGSNAGLS